MEDPWPRWKPVEALTCRKVLALSSNVPSHFTAELCRQQLGAYPPSQLVHPSGQVRAQLPEQKPDVYHKPQLSRHLGDRSTLSTVLLQGSEPRGSSARY